ncbi:hypothetical protein BHE74_00052215 [Ensete ventricosum]|nr:hypothetical protein BHE74_00052215 [Ensete ventricosum]RZR95615.1 hypothetical protein BHM03_00024464 [Ensete ventricosum]
MLSNGSSLLSSSTTIAALFFGLSHGPLLLLLSRLLPPATTSVDGAIQLRLSSADGTNKISIDLLVSSLLPLLMKLAEVHDRGRTPVAPSSSTLALHQFCLAGSTLIACVVSPTSQSRLSASQPPLPPLLRRRGRLSTEVIWPKHFTQQTMVGSSLPLLPSSLRSSPFSMKPQPPDNFSSDNRVDGVYCHQQPLASTLPPLLPCHYCSLLPKSLYLATAFTVPCHRCCHATATLVFRWIVPR